MIKADEQSLMQLNQQLQKGLDKFLEDTNAIFIAESALEAHWQDAGKTESFRNKILGVKGARFDAETAIIEAKAEIAEMIEIIRKYNAIKF